MTAASAHRGNILFQFLLRVPRVRFHLTPHVVNLLPQCLIQGFKSSPILLRILQRLLQGRRLTLQCRKVLLKLSFLAGACLLCRTELREQLFSLLNKLSCVECRTASTLPTYCATNTQLRKPHCKPHIPAALDRPF